MNTSENNLAIDIETIPKQNLGDGLKPVFDRDSVKLGNTKDPDKIEAKIDDAEAKFNNGLTKTMSLQSDFCQIVALGYIEFDQYGVEIARDCLFDEKDDKSIIERFLKIYNGQNLIGWNSKAFDIPVIRKRAILNGLKTPFDSYHSITHKYQQNSIDLMHDWNGVNDYGKMSHCAKMLGIECKTGLDGSMIYDAWKNGDFQPIKDYNISDCEAVVSIYKRLYL